MISKLKRVVSNSGPIIGLSKLSLLNLLWEIFDEVYVVNEVYNEIVIEGSDMPGSKGLKDAVEKGHIKVYKVSDEVLVNRFFGRLHRGELETIAAAKELNSEYVLIDDK
jgi:predicted nucleic acid-binding protein